MGKKWTGTGPGRYSPGGIPIFQGNRALGQESGIAGAADAGDITRHMCCGTFTNGLSIAQANDNNRIYGIDLSKPMLWEARRKVQKSGLENVRLKCADATDTHLAEKQFIAITVL